MDVQRVMEIDREVLRRARDIGRSYAASDCYPPMFVVGELDFSLAREIMPNFPLMLPERIKPEFPMMLIHRFDDYGPDPIQGWVDGDHSGPTGHPTCHRRQWRVKRESRKRNRRK